MQNSAPHSLTALEQRALEIIAQGEPSTEGWHNEGNGESGPSGGTLYGYRLGSTFLYQSPNGEIFIETGDEMPTRLPEPTGSPYAGIRAMIRSHLRDMASNAQRNGLEFVRTGQRPSEGYYSTDEVLARRLAR